MKKKPIIKGAIPTVKDSQSNNFLIKKIIATSNEMMLVASPIKVKNRKGIFECFIIPKIPIS